MKGQDLAVYAGLPGYELVVAGLHEIATAELGESGLLVAVCAPRLRRIGIDVPALMDPAEAKRQLWTLLESSHGDGAHARYNALTGRILSFAAAAESLTPASRRA